MKDPSVFVQKVETYKVMSINRIVLLFILVNQRVSFGIKYHYVERSSMKDIADPLR